MLLNVQYAGLRHQRVLIVFTTVYVPENSGLERFNYLALREFTRKPVVFKRVRGEQIPQLVDEKGSYGWTGNDLYCDYCLSNNNNSLAVLKFVPWPEETKPKLCLLGPVSLPADVYFWQGLRIVAPLKYRCLVTQYFAQQQWNPTLQFLEGQVERQIRQGTADLAIDIIYSGKTIRQENLEIYDVVFDDSGFVLLTKDDPVARGSLK